MPGHISSLTNEVSGQPEVGTTSKASLSKTRTIPFEPSTSTSCPSFSRLVASSSPETHGMPYSRATTAPCCSAPPISSTMPLALIKSGVQPGSVARATRISPGSRRFSCRVLEHLDASPRHAWGDGHAAQLATYGRLAGRVVDLPARVNDPRHEMAPLDLIDKRRTLPRQRSQIVRRIGTRCDRYPRWSDRKSAPAFPTVRSVRMSGRLPTPGGGTGRSP